MNEEELPVLFLTYTYQAALPPLQSTPKTLLFNNNTKTFEEFVA